MASLWDSVAAGQRTVEKPWGREIWWALTGSYAGKISQVKAGHSLILQYHRAKRESMLFLEGKGRLESNGRQIDLCPPMAVDIEPGTVHRVIATRDITFIEVSTPEVEDVVRLEDRYGRASEGPVEPQVP